jgi:ATP-binding cassette subfamily B protein
LILDDSLSAVDNRTEQQILDHIKAFMADKTSLLITHKLGALDHFDKVVVLMNGEVKESGSHHELMQKKGVYFEMYNRQQKQSDDNPL